MKIHSPSPHKQVPSKCNDYFFNYFTLGVVSCDSLEKCSISLGVCSALGRPVCTLAALTCWRMEAIRIWQVLAFRTTRFSELLDSQGSPESSH